MLNEKLTTVGCVSLTLKDESGQIKQKHDVNNLVVATGLNFLANSLKNSSTSPFTHMAVGTGTNAPASGDTTLQSELARAAFTSSSVTANAFQAVWTIPAGTATGALTEAGIFNNNVGGTLLSRVTFSAINKGASDTLTITWTVTIS